MTDTLELKQAVEQGNRLLEVLSEKSNPKLAELEVKLAAEIEAKSALEARLTAIENANARATGLSGKTAATSEDEHKSAFVAMLRDAKNPLAKQECEAKALVTGAGNADMIPSQIARDIMTTVRLQSPIAQLCTFVNGASPAYVQHVSSGSSYAMIGEGDAYPESTVVFTPKRPVWGTAVSRVRLSVDAINDIGANISAHVTTNFSRDFGQAMAYHFMLGTGAANQPVGLINGGQELDGGSAITSEALAAMPSHLATGYEARGSYIVSRSAMTFLRQAKNDAGHPLVSLVDGITRLHGFPIYQSDYMAEDTPVMFGDWEQAYLAASSKEGIRYLTNPYKADGVVELTGSLRFGGQILTDAAYVKLTLTP